MSHYATERGRLCGQGAPEDRITPDPRAVTCEACRKFCVQWDGQKGSLPGWTCMAIEPREATATVVIEGGTTIAYIGDFLIYDGRNIIVTNSVGKVRRARG